MTEPSKGRVLVLGAGGFIGRHVFAALIDAGYEPVGAVRRRAAFSRMFPDHHSVVCDMAKDVTPEMWQVRLQGMDAVVNCAGILSDRSSRAIHVDAPAALAAACERSGIRRLIHVSAISADRQAGTDYAREKLQAEDDLRARNLDWVILRPSLVYAQGTHGGTSVLRGLAGLPGVVPLPGDGSQLFSPIHVEDLARCIVLLLAPNAPVRTTLEPCGPENISLKEFVLAWRGWLGFGEPRIVNVPMQIVRPFARIVDLLGGGPLSTTAIRQLEFGNAGNGDGFAMAIGFMPLPMRAWLARRPSCVQDKWHARLYFLRPLLRWTLGLSWIAAGAIGALAPQEAVDAILRPFGWVGAAGELKWLTCLLDIGVGMALLSGQLPSLMLGIQVAIVAGYTAIISVSAPGLWLDPFGALVKNAVFLALAAVVAALEDDR
ncbi:SDR family oxidoreductase [Dongia sp.]|uniref:SDR family oxidoreductase n=1 Tax=Dongia sp. TaxID=1977262 RepID=UPI0035B1A0FF